MADTAGFRGTKRLGVLLLSYSPGFPWTFYQVIITGHRYPFILLGGHCESEVSCPRTQHNDPGQRSGVQCKLRQNIRRPLEISPDKLFYMFSFQYVQLLMTIFLLLSSYILAYVVIKNICSVDSTTPNLNLCQNYGIYLSSFSPCLLVVFGYLIVSHLVICVLVRSISTEANKLTLVASFVRGHSQNEKHGVVRLPWWACTQCLSTGTRRWSS